MILLLVSAAADAPDRTAVVTPDGGAVLRRAARRRTTRRRRRCAAAASHGSPSPSRTPPGRSALLAGAALAGAEPCQYQPDIEARELRQRAAALGHSVIVTRREDIGGRSRGDPAAGTVPGDHPTACRRQRRTVPSRSMIRHHRNHRRAEGGAPRLAGPGPDRGQAIRPRPEQRWLLAYGLHQFAGIQVLLHVLASRATLVAPFPRQPKDGLDALLADGVTLRQRHTDLLALPPRRGPQPSGRAPPPASRSRWAAKTSPADLLEELRTTFPVARVSQVYASTEFGSITSVHDGMPGLVDRRRCGAESTRHPTSAPRTASSGCAPRRGCWATQTSRPARHARDTAAWQPTGDLVEIVGRRVLFRGRQSEVINVGGVKVHPLPVEERIPPLTASRVARVFGRPSKLTGAIVAAEIVPAGRTDTDAASTSTSTSTPSAAPSRRPSPTCPAPGNRAASPSWTPSRPSGGKTVRGVQA